MTFFSLVRIGTPEAAVTWRLAIPFIEDLSKCVLYSRLDGLL